MSGHGACLPQRFLGEEFFKEGVIELVAGSGYDQVSQYRHAQKGEITEAIQHLMSNKLVRKAQTALVDYLVLIDDDGVVQ